LTLILTLNVSCRFADSFSKSQSSEWLFAGQHSAMTLPMSWSERSKRRSRCWISDAATVSTMTSTIALRSPRSNGFSMSTSAPYCRQTSVRSSRHVRLGGSGGGSESFTDGSTTGGGAKKRSSRSSICGRILVASDSSVHSPLTVGMTGCLPALISASDSSGA
jgi:hypothetical protein